ncbi:MAG: hypothetical protein H7258_15310 [Ferruginibacter sp.]|nr:hypothetical protein [Ferruginibacter sp.]
MKKILMLCVFATSFFASEAQTRKSKTKKSKKSAVTRQAGIQARFDSLQAKRQHNIDSTLTYQFRYDSVRKENERMADEKFQQEQMAWKENKYRELDSSNKTQWSALSKDHEHWLNVQKERDAVNKSANLSAYQDRQVNYINQSSFEKAKKINADTLMDDKQKKDQLVKLNGERRGSIKTIVGKSKEKKLEKARKEKKTSSDFEAQWINELDGYVKS